MKLGFGGGGNTVVVAILFRNKTALSECKNVAPPGEPGSTWSGYSSKEDRETRMQRSLLRPLSFTAKDD